MKVFEKISIGVMTICIYMFTLMQAAVCFEFQMNKTRLLFIFGLLCFTAYTVSKIREEIQSNKKGAETSCRYCRGCGHTDDIFKVITPNEKTIELAINYCPNCGRKLPHYSNKENNK